VVSILAVVRGTRGRLLPPPRPPARPPARPPTMAVSPPLQLGHWNPTEAGVMQPAQIGLLHRWHRIPVISAGWR
jgi:hypothetical protein